jgi:hypothetical protein
MIVSPIAKETIQGVLDDRDYNAGCSTVFYSFTLSDKSTTWPKKEGAITASQ